MNRRPFAFLCVSLLAFAALACSDEPERARCSECGMFITAESDWTVRSVRESGDTEYDAPKCAFRAEGSAAALRFMEYYGSGSQGGSALRFVVESDVQGPMGIDLVPVAPDRVEHFIADHGGRSVEFEAVDAALLESLRP
ncbi:MAG: hypothetical protein ACI9KE_001718 [Polyangiales bacterium]|jgi:hypothetical protein